MNFYEVLNVSQNATFDDIKKSYRTLSFKYHPDKNPGHEDEFKLVNEAYQTLSDTNSRKQYDFEINIYNDHNEINDNINTAMSNIFETMLNIKKSKKNNDLKDNFLNIFTSGIINGANSSNIDNIYFDNIPMPMPNSFNNLKQNDIDIINDEPDDIQIDINISFEDSYKGCCIPIIIERNVNKTKIYKEKENIYVDIPPGIDNNEIIEIKDKGNILNNKQGNIKIHVFIEPHISFYRNGINLILKQKISFKESLCGFSFNINHLNGNTIKFNSSKGNIIQNGDKKIIKDLGFFRNNQTGNLIIEFFVEHPPNKLTDEQLQTIDNIF